MTTPAARLGVLVELNLELDRQGMIRLLTGEQHAIIKGFLDDFEKLCRADGRLEPLK